MAQINITLSQDEVLQVLSGNREDKTFIACIGSEYPLPYFALQNCLLGSVPNPRNGKER